MEALLETKIFKVSVERLLLNGGQTLYMVGIALLIGTVLGTLLALVLVLCRKGGLVENKVLHSIVSLYINVVRSVPLKNFFLNTKNNKRKQPNKINYREKIMCLKFFLKNFSPPPPQFSPLFQTLS